MFMRTALIGLMLAAASGCGRAPDAAAPPPAAPNVVAAPPPPTAGGDDEDRTERRLREEAEGWDDAILAREVETFVFDGGSDEKVLKQLGARVHAAALEILGDAADAGAQPFRRVCRLFGDAPPASVVDPLARYAESPVAEIREEAAFVLGRAGLPEAVAPLKKILGGADREAAEQALLGLQMALRDGRPGLDIRPSLYEDVRKLVEAGSCDAYAADVLVRLDRDRAAAYLLSDDYWKARPSSFPRALHALADVQIPAPVERVRPLIAELEKADPKEPVRAALDGAYRLLGQARVPEDREFLEARTAGGDGAAAMKGLLAFHDLEGFDDRLWETDSSTWNGSQKLAAAVLMLDMEVLNGGFDQYFVNSSGDRWKEAVEGLREMGSVELAGLLNEAVARFGATPPSADRATRLDQLDAIARADADAFDPIDDRWYESKESVDVLTGRFVIAHAADFR
ncbi:DMP19 family protein [Paludisphaera mucosa]|uniref:DUF4375 domain-containing protein n=1 Tax=Paludisphaera mucosa TaxID=3030827 RepID=A0ABT6F939_9BACT|nr:DUF4375 domain-containing protein [Paludisphaera mucosa]MDG3004098.1 DUF4375 domain-containing protein [Paludisphaera mucosa]